MCKFLVDGCDARVQRSREDWVSIDPKGFLSTTIPWKWGTYILDGMEYALVMDRVCTRNLGFGSAVEKWVFEAS